MKAYFKLVEISSEYKSTDSVPVDILAFVSLQIA